MVQELNVITPTINIVSGQPVVFQMSGKDGAPPAGNKFLNFKFLYPFFIQFTINLT